MGNLLGDGFNDFVRNQINVRQKSLGKYTNISTKDLLYYQNKTPFLKLASSVNLESKGKNTNLLSGLLGINESDIVNEGLAKKCILHGGVVDKETSTPQSGLRFKNDNLFSGAYGWGGGERGFVPQPGIVGADITYYNDGALSKATVSIKCFSREQFAIIDALYMRPGFSILLEFGWSLYLDENSNITSIDTFNSPALEKFFEGTTDDNFAIYKKIQEGRKKYKGNYDGIYGKISKFDWKFNSDGSYDITVQITGYGDMIESLYVNLVSNNTLVLPSKDQSTNNNSIGGNAGYLHSSGIFISTSSQSDESQEKFNKNRSPLHKSLYDLSIPPEDIKKDKNSLYYSSKIEIDRKTVNLDETLLHIKDLANKDKKIQTYIPFYLLLLLCQDSFILNKNDNSPITGFDFDFSDIKNDKNYIVNLPGQFSSDPKKVLIPFSMKLVNSLTLPPLNEKGQAFIKFLKENIPNFSPNTSKDFKGKLAYVYLNVENLISILDSIIMEDENKKEKISLFEFLTQVLNIISNSLGDVSSLSLKLNNDEGKIQIIESSPLILQQPEKISKFNLFGVSPTQGGSFIKNVDLSSGLTDEFATQIVIGSSQNSSPISKNATSFKNYNKGLKDRVYPDKINPQYDLKFQSSNFISQLSLLLAENAKNFSSSFKQIYDGNMKWDREAISLLSTINYQIQNISLNIASENLGTSPFFLPFNLKLTMDGLGGMKLYQKFGMDQKILPPMYDDSEIDLIIKGINHSITTTGWTTTLDSLSVPKIPIPNPSIQYTGNDPDLINSNGTDPNQTFINQG